jgi:hypothetical protein
MENTSGQAMTQAWSGPTAYPASASPAISGGTSGAATSSTPNSASGTRARSISPRQARRPARPMATATCSTSASCGLRAARLVANTRASVSMPALVTRRVSWPSAERTRSTWPAASNSTSSMSWQGQPAER